MRYYKEPKINSMIPNFQYPTPIDREVNWDKSKTIMSRTDAAGVIDYVNQVTTRSEERRVGKECRSRWSPYH